MYRFLKKQVKQKKVVISDRFEKLFYEGVLSESELGITKFHFLGAKKQFEVRGKGNVFLTKNPQKDSTVYLLFIDNSKKLTRDLQKYAGTNQIHFKLQGKGFSVLPVYDYTAKKLLKTAKNSNFVKKEQKKLMKNLQKEGEKLLKGLFQK
jgi:hypothetical protein